MVREIMKDETVLAQKKAQYQNEKFQVRFKTLNGWTAQIIRHEVDHCEGIVI